MTIDRLRFAILFAVLFLVIQMVSAETLTVSVGGTTILLPSPDGFFRLDGKSTKVDSQEQQLFPKSNRLLAVFGSAEELAEVLTDRFPIGRQFNAQSDRSLESIDITSEVMAALKQELRKQLPSPQKMKDYQNFIQELNRNASVLSSDDLKAGETIPLGSFGDTKDSLCFSMLQKFKSTTVSQGDRVAITAFCCVRVTNRVLYLYASSRYRDNSDLEWAQQSVQRWRDAILKANGE